jgi:hypothetical protein
MIRESLHGIGQNLHNAWTNIYMLSVMAVSDVLIRSDMVVHADDHFVTQMDKSLISAIPADKITGYGAIDLGVQLGYVGGSFELASRTTSKKGLVLTAGVAQLGACLADAGVERSGAMSAVARGQEDVGASAVFMGWMTKFFLDRSREAKEAGDTTKRRNYLGGLAALGAGMTVGAYGVEGAQNGLLLLSSHFTGIVAGAFAHRYAIRHPSLNRQTNTQEALT